MEEKIDKMQQKLEEAVQRIDQQVQHLSTQFKESNQRIQDNTKQIEEIENKLAVSKQEIEKQKEENKKIQEDTKSFMDATLTIEMEKAAHILRFRNIEEHKDQDLMEMICGPLAEVLDREIKEMEKEIDQVYGVNSSYMRINKVPREVHENFVRRDMRDKIVTLTNEKPMVIQGKEIIILKQIPPKIREVRKQYHFLTSKLNTRKINFRWLVPEGIMVNWWSIREFDRKYFSTTEEALSLSKGRAEREKTGASNEQQDEPNTEMDQQEMMDLDIALGAKRKTRAVNPTYKQ